MTCMRDTDGDGNCGRRLCLECGDGARAPAVEVERVVNADQPAAAADPPEPPSVKVSISSFGRAVEIEAPDGLDRVSAVALQLWQATESRSPMPVGAMGFMMSEPSGPAPLEMTPRVLDPLYERGNQHAA